MIDYDAKISWDIQDIFVCSDSWRMVQHGLLAFPSGWLKDVFLECTNIQFELHHVADSASARTTWPLGEVFDSRFWHLCASPPCTGAVSTSTSMEDKPQPFLASGGYRRCHEDVFFPTSPNPKPQTRLQTPSWTQVSQHWKKQTLFLWHEVSRRIPIQATSI